VSTAGLVLAAGSGRRMGGPKALLRTSPSGPTLLERAVATLRAAGVEPVVVVVGARPEETAAAAKATGSTVVLAADWAEGMGASLRAGLRHLSAAPDSPAAAVVTLVDLPDIVPEVVTRVLAAVEGDPAAALVRAAYDGVPGHPVALGREHWAGVLDSAAGDRGARDYLARTEHRLVECGDLASGRDLDTVSDLGPT
jgi:CTP:molybdopterin cytidylyltransferase MocA